MLARKFGRIGALAVALVGFYVAIAAASESPFADTGNSATGQSAAGDHAPSSPFRAEALPGPDSVAAGEVTELRFVLRIPPEHYAYAERCTLVLLPDPGLEWVDLREPLPEKKMDIFLEEEVDVHKHDATFVARVRAGWPLTVRAVLSSQGCSATMCFFPQDDTLRVALVVAGTATVGTASSPAPPGNASARVQAAAERGLAWLLVLAFGAGVATSFTPCIYPMIPITIGIIGARSAGKRSRGFTLSLLYVLGIAVTYSALGTTAALTGSLFGSVLQNPWVLVAVAGIFGLMAMSMFGAFELQVPAGFAGRMNRVQGSGYPGAFLLGLIAGIVASPCIGPVLVAMLAYVAAQGSPTLGFALFFTFALGLGVLFIALGTFTGVLASLPKSGAWMDRVKIGFGLVFLGVALHYLHPILRPGKSFIPVGLGLAAIGLVLGALRSISPAEPTAKRWRKSAGRVALALGLYAVVAPLVGRAPGGTPGPAWIASESDGRSKAAAAGKPMLVDFGAAWCGACKELEHLTFSDPRVIELARGFVTVRVDATKRTPEVDALMRQYGIRGLPWVAFVQSDGTILHDLTVTGFVDADEMLARMHRALPARNAAAS